MSWVLYGLAFLLIFLSVGWEILSLSNPKSWLGSIGMVIGIMLVFIIGFYKGEHSGK